MKQFLSAILICVVTACNAQTVQNSLVIIGKTDSVNSKILNEKRKVWVHVPNAMNDPAYTKTRYPVVYLLDGEGHFPSVAGMIQQLSEVNGNTICPEMIIVAIPNTDRTRDLTPSNASIGPDGKHNDGFKSSGGGEKFTAFLEKELIPHIDSLYPTAPYRVLIGHSFGGLTVMNIVVNHTNLFNAYVAIDPSMWWDSKKLLNQAHEVMQQKKFEGKSLFLAIANTMPAGMDTLQVRKDTIGNTGHIRSILELSDVLKNSTASGLNWSYKYYKNDNHGSVPLIAEYDALHFLFSYYPFPQEVASKMFDPKAKIDIAAAINSHYVDVSKHMGYKTLPPEAQINEMGYFYLQSQAPEKAYTLFNMNIQNYPGSFNVFDSMGDYYSAQKDKVKAIEFFNKALKLKENPETREKLTKLQASK
ncbi:MAG TPA: alpha/beta hydrolase-fold protein [Mucilaginibacter sp.]|nr:alpha/beta hydrolase-fold protein [Mucilaginibacter sp.]